jgi:transcription elongation factor Elf1
MGTEYDYDMFGNLIDEFELSVEGEKMLFCTHCNKPTLHYLEKVSKRTGEEVYSCSVCGRKYSDE